MDRKYLCLHYAFFEIFDKCLSEEELKEEIGKLPVGIQEDLIEFGMNNSEAVERAYSFWRFEKDNNDMAAFVAYHPETEEIALFETDGLFWVGAYSPHMTHQNGEPNYYLIAGMFHDKMQALNELNKTDKEAF